MGGHTSQLTLAAMSENGIPEYSPSVALSDARGLVSCRDKKVEIVLPREPVWKYRTSGDVQGEMLSKPQTPRFLKAHRRLLYRQCLDGCLPTSEDTYLFKASPRS